MILKTAYEIFNHQDFVSIVDGRFLDQDESVILSIENKVWKEKKRIKFENVEIWEVILEWGYNSGIYAAWNPMSHYFIIIENGSLKKEFWGIQAEKKVLKYCKENGIFLMQYPRWFEEEYIDQVKRNR